MERVAYLVNSTPAYYYLLPFHFTMIKRYGVFMENLFLATEVPDHPICQQVNKEFGVTLIPLDTKHAGFLESRAAALRQLSLTGKFTFVLPVQEDFILERDPDFGALVEALTIMGDSGGLIASARLMPCPGPKGPTLPSRTLWAGLTSKTDEYGFTFQATLWTLDACCAWYMALAARLEEGWPAASTSAEQRKHIEIRANFAENADGQHFFWKFFKARQQVHIGWVRVGPQPNAVYLSPWPYRPTAIVQGRLESWAQDLARREGVNVSQPTTLEPMTSLYDFGRGY